MSDEMLVESLPSGKLKCMACVHGCEIAAGKCGICGVRQNHSGKLVLTVRNHPNAVHIDPIEKKPLYHFLPGSRIFSVGTIGCNFGCDFCQNWDLSQAGKIMSGKILTGLDSLTTSELTPRQIVDFCLAEQINAIAFTYNEPTIFSEWAAEIMQLARPYGIRGVFVSNGYMTEHTLDYLDNWIDAFNIDLKSFRDAFYRSHCKARLAPVLKSIESIYARGKWLEVTTLLIPGENDSAEEIRQSAGFLAAISTDIPWHLSAFHPDYLLTSLRPTAFAELVQAREIAHEAGLKYVYLGNVSGRAGHDTHCPECHHIVIERRSMGLLVNRLVEARCPQCGCFVRGVWN